MVIVMVLKRKRRKLARHVPPTWCVLVWPPQPSRHEEAGPRLEVKHCNRGVGPRVRRLLGVLRVQRRPLRWNPFCTSNHVHQCHMYQGHVPTHTRALGGGCATAANTSTKQISLH